MRDDEIAGFVAARLKALRLARGYSLRQLAHRCDLTPEMLSRAERRERTPSLETLAKVCTGLQLSVAEFFEASASEVPSSVPRPSAVRMHGIPAVLHEVLREDVPAINLRAQEHFLDAIRSIEKGMRALGEGDGQRRRKR